MNARPAKLGISCSDREPAGCVREGTQIELSKEEMTKVKISQTDDKCGYKVREM
jgi:hypothetical protein